MSSEPPGGGRPPIGGGHGPRCATCGELIGVYEPAVWVVDGRVRTTSRAADPDVSAEHGRAFHAGCYKDQ
jgi:hypothetical protein